ncbi:MAG: thioredoxin family protein [Flavobacteriales bacterium]|nr:thioredoxin family protein [Flavobacteriales bacterium]
MKKLVLLLVLATMASTNEINLANAAPNHNFKSLALLAGGDKGDIEVITGGKAMYLPDLLSTGKITILDFYAPWCGPCRALSPKLEKFVKANPKVALKKLDIVNWSSGLFKQISDKYGAQSIPFVLIFDDSGKLLGRVIGNDIVTIKVIVTENV